MSNLKKAILIEQNTGRLSIVRIDVNNNQSIVKALKGVRANGIQFPELKDYDYNVTVWTNVIKKKGDCHNAKASKLATKKVYGDVLVTDSEKDLDVDDYNKILKTLAADAQMKQEAFEKAKTDAIAEIEAAKLKARDEEDAAEIKKETLIVEEPEDDNSIFVGKMNKVIEAKVEDVEDDE